MKRGGGGGRRTHTNLVIREGLTLLRNEIFGEPRTRLSDELRLLGNNYFSVPST